LHPAALPSLRAPVSRFISTERKKKWKEQLKWQIRFQLYFWPTALLCALVYAGVQQTKLEREFPTPRDWSFWSRWHLRTAKYTEFDEDAKLHRVLTDWARAAFYYGRVLERLEDENVDGKFLIEQDIGGILVEGVGKTGYDISMKSDQWRRGYYEALIGAARTSEHLEGMCKRKGEERGRLYPYESIPGPSNPRPKPMPWDKRGYHEHVPSEFEVEPAFPAPETFYMRILTTKGFDNRQRLDAALAYADWCDFKGLIETAGNMYNWALDIAAGGLPTGADGVVDIRTGVIAKGKEEYVSENLLRATTSLGVHHARRGEVKEALPVFLSVLRARKSLRPLPVGFRQENQATRKDESGLWSYLLAFKDLIVEAPYPKPPSSGDEPPFHTLKEACEEVGLMTYIGEILFATSMSEKEKGLSWTRDSVEAAEAVMWVMDEQKQEDGRERCRECLETGLQNWKAMAKQMSQLAVQAESEAEKSTGWLGTGMGKMQKVEHAKTEVMRWEEEETQIELRRQKTLPLTQPLKPTASGWMSMS